MYSHTAHSSVGWRHGARASQRSDSLPYMCSHHTTLCIRRHPLVKRAKLAKFESRVCEARPIIGALATISLVPSFFSGGSLQC